MVNGQNLIDLSILLFVSVMCYVFTCYNKRIGMIKGIVMILTYVVFMIYIVIRA